MRNVVFSVGICVFKYVFGIAGSIDIWHRWQHRVPASLLIFGYAIDVPKHQSCCKMLPSIQKAIDSGSITIVAQYRFHNEHIVKLSGGKSYRTTAAVPYLNYVLKQYQHKFIIYRRRAMNIVKLRRKSLYFLSPRLLMSCRDIHVRCQDIDIRCPVYIIPMPLAIKKRTIYFRIHLTPQNWGNFQVAPVYDITNAFLSELADISCQAIHNLSN